MPLQHSGFDHQRIFDASFDPLSGFVLMACGHSLYGIDESNRVDCLAGDPYAGDGAVLVDGPAVHARFTGAQRLAAAGGGLTFIRDRCSASRNGFLLRALHELPLPAEQGGGGTGLRAATTVHMGAAGDEEELRYGMGAGGGMDAGVNPCLMWPGACSFMPFTNIQAVAADPDGSGDIYVLDGVSGSSTTLKVLRGDGQLDTLAVGLRIGPKGSGRWPRLAALPGRRLIIYGVSQHDLMILQL
eukprot:XP_001701535.1 predicted protein [Chlamydomonas reinhardtii]